MATLADTLAKRRADWQRLELMLAQISRGNLKGMRGESISELNSLYRSACADLAMAEQYRLSPDTINYLHNLVGKAHNSIYRSRRFQLSEWWEIAFHKAPQQIFRDPCVHICTILFFGVFNLSAYVAFRDDLFPDFAETAVGSEQLQTVEGMYGDMDFERGLDDNAMMVAFYINNNTGIGLKCFALGPLIIPGLFITGYNACTLGVIFGYMARGTTDGGDNFLEFVTAHGAFELTAIALAAAAGLRIGSGWLFTRGLTRLESVQQRGREAMPVISASVVLFFLAAFTEGLISPSGIPYVLKALWGIFSSCLLMFYFVVLGYPTESSRAT